MVATVAEAHGEVGGFEQSPQQCLGCGGEVGGQVGQGIEQLDFSSVWAGRCGGVQGGEGGQGGEAFVCRSLWVARRARVNGSSGSPSWAWRRIEV